MADLLTIAEAAERLRVSARTVEREIAARLSPDRPPGRRQVPAGLRSRVLR